jgi:hypothetical protein
MGQFSTITKFGQNQHQGLHFTLGYAEFRAQALATARGGGEITT